MKKEPISVAKEALIKISNSHDESYSAQVAKKALDQISKIERNVIFTTNQGLGHNQSVTCEVIKIERDDVYGKYISSNSVNQENINLSIPFSLTGLIMEGNSHLTEFIFKNF